MPIVKPCATSGCRVLLPAGQRHCDQHRRLDNQRRATKAHAHGRTTAHWQRLRQLALTRDAHTCQACGHPGSSVHLHPSLHGNHHHAELEHVVTLCASCHGTIDAPRSRAGTGGGGLA